MLGDLWSCEEQALRDADTVDVTSAYYLDELLKDGAEIVALKE